MISGWKECFMISGWREGFMISGWREGFMITRGEFWMEAGEDIRSNRQSTFHDQREIIHLTSAVKIQGKLKQFF